MTDGDAIPIRLSASQMSAIWPGLDFVVKAYASARDKKRLHYEYPFRVFPPPPHFDRGTYEARMMSVVLGLWKRLRPKATVGGRVQMDAMEIRTAIFAIRVDLGLWRRRRHDARRWDAATKSRMKLDQRSLHERDRRSRRVIASLERHMKRANRRLRGSLTEEEYDALMRGWQRHLRWMRLHLVYFKPLPPVIMGRKTNQQRAIDKLTEMAAQGLRSQGFEPPDAIELRSLMRLFARSSRRGREGDFTVPFMLGHSKAFTPKWYLARFILDRMELKELK